jgi:hypothetical protein
MVLLPWVEGQYLRPPSPPREEDEEEDDDDLRLPGDYDGFILVTDIDDTLRHTTLLNVISSRFRQRRIHRVRHALFEAARRGIPVVYLSAASARLMRRTNQRFLSRYPRGVLYDRVDMPWSAFLPWRQVHTQSRFKRCVLRKLVAAYPYARLLCLGDNRYGDAIAYSDICDRVLIRRIPGTSADRNLPPRFDGRVFRRYDRRTLTALLPSEEAAAAEEEEGKGIVYIPSLAGVPVGRSV